VLPAIVLLAVLGAWAVLVGTAQLRCTDAAGVGARALARGEPADEVRRVVAEVAPHGARGELGASGVLVVVDVRVLVPLPGPWGDHGPGVAGGDRAGALDESAGPAPGPGAPP
jgi:hypothetical protein